MTPLLRLRGTSPEVERWGSLVSTGKSIPSSPARATRALTCARGLALGIRAMYAIPKGEPPF